MSGSHVLEITPGFTKRHPFLGGSSVNANAFNTKCKPVDSASLNMATRVTTYKHSVSMH